MGTISEANGFRSLELRHLVAFDAVARHRSFTLAADELGYSQSAVSQQISDLERIAGSRVFVRFAGPRPVELTEAGRVLLVHAAPVLARMSAISVDLDAVAQGAVGDVRVGTFQSAASLLLPPVLAAFRAAWPRIRVGLFESGSHDELDLQVERGSLDLAFTNPPLPKDAPLEYTELLTDPYVLVVARGHPLARRRALPSLGVLAKIDLVGYRVCRANASIERFVRSRGVEPRVVVRAEDNHLLQGLAAAGVGAAIMPILAVDRSRDDAVILDASHLIPNRRIGIVRHRDRYRSPAALAFVEQARDTVGSIEVPRP
ncbi:MAG: LysR family transcriptional regulator [Chloroflexi bacterium]|nr:LysR family transcriptional regulator [Chloroflexota bacterium]